MAGKAPYQPSVNATQLTANEQSSSVQKRGRTDSINSPTSNDLKKKKEGDVFVCPICVEVIVETTETTEGQDAIFCESQCNTWLHRKCAGISKAVFKALENSKSPFYCVHCRLKAYEAQFAELNSTIKGLQKQVSDLERKVANKSVDHTPPVAVKETENKSIINQPADPESKAVDTLKSYISEEKEKASRRLNIILHNVAESSASEGHVRKEQDTDQVKENFKQIMGSSIEITKCVRIGKKLNKPNKHRLLKIGVNTESIKKQILRNSVKLRDDDKPAHMKKIFITPDLTPNEQKLNNKLRAKLKEKNKGGNLFKIKNGTIVQRNPN